MSAIFLAEPDGVMLERSDVAGDVRVPERRTLAGGVQRLDKGGDDAFTNGEAGLAEAKGVGGVELVPPGLRLSRLGVCLPASGLESTVALPFVNPLE